MLEEEFLGYYVSYASCEFFLPFVRHRGSLAKESGAEGGS